MTDIFVSYRREDSSGWAGSLSRSLRESFGAEQVFADIITLEPGADFTEVIEQKLRSIRVLLAVIGPHWLTVTDKKGQRRLDNPDDLVRGEIATALRLGVRVVPVLVGGATLPSSEELPDDLKGLARRHACELSDTRWDYDQQRLIALLGQSRHAAAPGIISAMQSSFRRTLALASTARTWIIVGFSVLVVAIGLFGLTALYTSPRGLLAPLRVTLVSYKTTLIRPFFSYLKERGAVPSLVSTDELAKLSPARPDIVLVGSDTVGRWQRNEAGQLKQIFDNYKVIGVGEAGDELFRLLDLPLTSVMHNPGEDTLAVAAADLLKSPIKINTDGGRIEIYRDKTSDDILGLYDSGSPDIAGFEGIARWQKFTNHWPIARRGNYLFIGFDMAVDRMTDSGKDLLANILSNHKAQPWTPLSKITEEIKSREAFRRIAPGLTNGSLTAQLPGSKRIFEVTRPGPIQATLTWESEACPLTLILNGPGQVGYYQRKDGASPLSFEFAVTEDLIAKGKEWAVTVTCFRYKGSSPINYTLQLAFPSP
jgi:hypothetical protein